MESEAQRIERRLQEWTLQAERNKEAREAKQTLIEQKREEAVRLEARAAARPKRRWKSSSTSSRPCGRTAKTLQQRGCAS